MSQAMTCPKCRGVMRTYDRSGVHIEQCDNCRGVFLDYGELESLSQLESRWNAPPPQAPPAYGQGQPAYGQGQPGWGGQHHGHHKKKSFGHMLFSS